MEQSLITLLLFIHYHIITAVDKISLLNFKISASEDPATKLSIQFAQDLAIANINADSSILPDYDLKWELKEANSDRTCVGLRDSNISIVFSMQTISKLFYISHCTQYVHL